MRYAPLVERIAGRGAAAWDTHIEARRRQEEGEDIIFLTVGDPDQDPPETVIEATVTALRAGRTGYSAIIGYPALREAIAARVARRAERPCGAENVAVVPGAQGGLYCAVQCLAGPGDEIVVPEPIYATYEGVAGASGATLVTVPLRCETGFHPDPEALAAAVTPRTRVIWINTPHNPTGAVFTTDEIAAIGALCRRRDLWLLSDEVYEDLAFARPHVSAWSLPDMEERTVVVSSLSKSHALPGFRLGWVAGPPALIRHLFNLLLSMTYGGPAFIQDGALAALSGELPEVAALRDAYRGRAALLSERLRPAPGCRVVPPEGGMFVLLDVRGTGLDAAVFAARLLAAEAVAVLPCDGFGPSAAGHLRIALCASEARLGEAGARIARFARSLARSHKGLAAGLGGGIAVRQSSGMTSDSEIAALARLIDQARRAAVFTGAGISTESGIPDFRSPGGIWTQMAPIYFDEFLASEEARCETWRRRFAMQDHFGGALPNRGHRAVDALVRRGKAGAVITQNIDGLHQASGVPPEKIIELHGNTTYATCLDCGARYEIADLRAVFECDGAVPPCEHCFGHVKTAMVSFGQSMPPVAMRRAEQEILAADLCIVLGSSLVVYPAAGFPELAKHNGARLAIVNREATPLDRIADLVIHAGIGDVMGGAVGVN